MYECHFGVQLSLLAQSDRIHAISRIPENRIISYRAGCSPPVITLQPLGV
jgi:hypothetical protein